MRLKELLAAPQFTMFHSIAPKDMNEPFEKLMENSAIELRRGWDTASELRCRALDFCHRISDT